MSIYFRSSLQHFPLLKGTRFAWCMEQIVLATLAMKTIQTGPLLVSGTLAGTSKDASELVMSIMLFYEVINQVSSPQ